MPPRMVRNLFGEWVPEDEPQPEQPREQGTLFQNEFTEEERRARKLAEQHYSEGGRDLLPDKPKDAE